MKIHSMNGAVGSNKANKVNFGVRLTPLETLQLATRTELPNAGGLAGVLSTIKKMTGDRISPYQLGDYDPQCRKALFKQYPIFKEISENFHSKMKNLSQGERERYKVEFVREYEDWNDIDIKPIKIKRGMSETPAGYWWKRIKDTFRYYFLEG